MSNAKTLEKLKILSDAAKYDVSCSSSGVERKNKNGIGNARNFGICHSWSADGRCISLLKILMTNKCIYNCTYCVNRCEAETNRASFEPKEIAELTFEFYKRNYIEGLFLSSAVEKSPNYTMEKMLKTLQLLRNSYHFHGYVHAKVIPGTDPIVINQIGLLADRISVNIELPSKNSLQLLAPQKKMNDIIHPMKHISQQIIENKDNKKHFRNAQKFVSAGQTTQMIIGASNENDYHILNATQKMYQKLKLKRVYFSAYMPVVESSLLPSVASPPPLKRENRLYQADWLLRFYHFKAEEIIDMSSPFLDLEMDPKMAWALKNIHLFPIEINKAPYEDLLRIPGLGLHSAYKIMGQRRNRSIKFEDLKKMGTVLKRAQYFITCNGKYYPSTPLDPTYIKESLHPKPSQEQLSFWSQH